MDLMQKAERHSRLDKDRIEPRAGELGDGLSVNERPGGLRADNPVGREPLNKDFLFLSGSKELNEFVNAALGIVDGEMRVFGRPDMVSLKTGVTLDNFHYLTTDPNAVGGHGLRSTSGYDRQSVIRKVELLAVQAAKQLGVDCEQIDFQVLERVGEYSQQVEGLAVKVMKKEEVEERKRLVLEGGEVLKGDKLRRFLTEAFGIFDDQLYVKTSREGAIPELFIRDESGGFVLYLSNKINNPGELVGVNDGEMEGAKNMTTKFVRRMEETAIGLLVPKQIPEQGWFGVGFVIGKEELTKGQETPTLKLILIPKGTESSGAAVAEKSLDSQQTHVGPEVSENDEYSQKSATELFNLISLEPEGDNEPRRRAKAELVKRWKEVLRSQEGGADIEKFILDQATNTTDIDLLMSKHREGDVDGFLTSNYSNKLPSRTATICHYVFSYEMLAEAVRRGYVRNRVVKELTRGRVVNLIGFEPTKEHELAGESADRFDNEVMAIEAMKVRDQTRETLGPAFEVVGEEKFVEERIKAYARMGFYEDEVDSLLESLSRLRKGEDLPENDPNKERLKLVELLTKQTREVFKDPQKMKGAGEYIKRLWRLCFGKLGVVL